MFEPLLSILPDAQARLWPKLKDVPRSFILYGGTAIALRIGHRQSVDFDFFSADYLDKSALRGLPVLEGFRTLTEDANTLVGLVGTGDETVKLSFFGGMRKVPILEPELTSDAVLRVARLAELMGFKLKAIHDRAEGKDYEDIAAMLEVGIGLDVGFDVAITMFGDGFPVAHTLRGLTYFQDLHEAWRVTDDRQSVLRKAAASFPIDYSPRLRG
jgi:hypothetical protein